MEGTSSTIFRIGLLIGLLLVYSISPIDALDRFTVDPHGITFNGTAGNVSVTKMLMITAADNVTGLSIFATDLQESRGARSIDSEAIGVPQEAFNISNGTVRQIPIRFDYSRISSGIYSGEIWLTSPTGGTVKVPVASTIKDDPTLPAIVLVAGVVIAFLLFTYGSQLKRRDEILRALIRIEEESREDVELEEDVMLDDPQGAGKRKNPYCDLIQYDIKRVREKLDIGTTADADTALTTLQNDWNSWNTSQPRLIPLFGAISQMTKDLAALEKQILNDGRESSHSEVKGTVTAIVEIRTALLAKFENITADAGGKDVHAELIHATESFNLLNRAAIGIIRLDRACTDRANRSEKCGKVQEWWDLLKVTKLDGIKTLSDEVEKDLTEVERIEKEVTFGGSGQDRLFEGGYQALQDLVVPEIPSIAEKRRRWIEKVKVWFRLSLYRYGTYAVIVIIISMEGFKLLYLSNPTFGSSIEDYISLGLWGLLSGSTAQTISQNLLGAKA
jgi:hypothetical protein